MRLLYASLVLAATAGSSPPQADMPRLGPAVGSPAPTVSLQDQHGRTQTLATVAGPKGTMLVFFRSADW